MTESIDVAVEISPKPVMRLSASRIQTWMDCPQKAKFRYVDRLPDPQNAAASFGSAVHKGLEVYNNSGENLDMAIATFTEWWHNPEKYGIAPEVWPKRGRTFKGYLAAGIDAITSYHEQMRWAKRTVIAVEHKFLVRFGDFELTGVVDVIEIVKNKKGVEVVRIVDYKTGKAPTIANLKANIQFTTYDWASRQKEFWTGSGTPEFPGVVNGDWWWEMLKNNPRENTWYAVMQGRAYDAGEREDADFLRLYRVAKAIEKAIDLDVYVPDISGDTCGFCPYTGPCRLPFNPADEDD